MKSKRLSQSRLARLELSTIDLTINALQAAGHKFDGADDDDMRQAMAEAMAEMHMKGFPQMREQDRAIIAEIKKLARQLSSRTSLRELLIARGKILQRG